MKSIFFAIITTFCLFSCTEKKGGLETDSQTEDTTEAKPKFFPVTEFLAGQIALFDSMPVTPLHLTTINGKTDSEWIKREQLKTFLNPFVTHEINDSNLIKYFTESKFNDQTIDAATLSYLPKSTKPDSLSLSMWNVYINPKKGRVIKIYIQKNIKENNQNITQQLTWQVGKYAEITSIINTPDGKSSVLKREKFIWNFDQ